MIGIKWCGDDEDKCRDSNVRVINGERHLNLQPHGGFIIWTMMLTMMMMTTIIHVNHIGDNQHYITLRQWQHWWRVFNNNIGDGNWDNQDNEKEWEWKSNPQTPLKGPLFQHLTLYTSLAIPRLPNPILSFTFMLVASSLRNQKLEYVIIIQNFPIDTQFNLHVMAIWIAWFHTERLLQNCFLLFVSSKQLDLELITVQWPMCTAVTFWVQVQDNSFARRPPP